MTDHRIHRGSDENTEFLVTIWDDGEMELSVRPLDMSRCTWSAPVGLQPVPAEVCS